MTAVEFSAEDPYGKAVALLNLKSGMVKVQCFKYSFFNDKVYSNHSFTQKHILMLLPHLNTNNIFLFSEKIRLRKDGC